MLVSVCNYLFGNFLFALLWGLSDRHFAYWEIATVSTCLSSVFSYQTQSRLILRQGTESFINLYYVSFQLLGLAFAILAVPSISGLLQMNIVIIQFGWSAFYSLISLVLLRKRKFSS